MKRKEEYEKLLVVVDMVNGFVKYGNMADSYINHITPRIKELLDEFVLSGECISFICDSHEKNSSEFKKFPIHCIKGSGEEEVISELQEYLKHANIYEKNSTSTMFAPNFMNDLEKMKKLKEVIITGCCTDICVLNLAIPLSNYFDQNNRDVLLTIYKDAVETYDSPLHNRDEYNSMAFKLMKQNLINVR